MTVRSALAEGRRRLAPGSGDTPHLDALVLLARALGMRKEGLYSRLEDEIPDGAAERYRGAVAQRLRGVPVAYLIGEKEFYGREFTVDERVLVPRPDTETLVEAVLAIVDANPWIGTLHDVGTGSGCIALTIKAERPSVRVTASDISSDAGEVFSINAERLGIHVRFSRADLLDGLGVGLGGERGHIDFIVSNPPYLSNSEADAARGSFEPDRALRAGPEGIELLTALINGAPEVLAPRGFIALEIAPTQSREVTARLEHHGFSEVQIHPDLAGRARAVTAFMEDRRPERDFGCRNCMQG